MMTPVWRLRNGHGPSWRFGQAQVTTDTSFQAGNSEEIVEINFCLLQVIIEGIWGNNRASGHIAVDDVTFYDGVCGTVPQPAGVIKGECSFDRDACGWRNTSTVSIAR